MENNVYKEVECSLQINVVCNNWHGRHRIEPEKNMVRVTKRF